jgi:hypothetical protein
MDQMTEPLFKSLKLWLTFVMILSYRPAKGMHKKYATINRYHGVASLRAITYLTQITSGGKCMEYKKRTSLIVWGAAALVGCGALMATNSLAVGIDAQPAAFESRMVDGVSNFGEWMGEHAFAIAADGTQYAAYGGDYLYLAKKGPSDTEWQVETVDNTWRVGKYTSLALDSNGNPHISYSNHSDARDLKYARWDGNKWQVETVDGADSNVGIHNAIALDSENKPHIVYGYYWYDADTSSDIMSPRYAHWDGTAWQISDVALDTHMSGTDSEYSSTSIAIDSSNTPHISYFQENRWDGSTWNNTGDLMYATWNGTAWVTTGVDTDGDYDGRNNSIAVDSNDYPHISYSDASNQDLEYARWDGLAWQLSTVAGGGAIQYGNSIAIGSNDYPQIAYYEHWPTYGGKLASWNGGGWEISTVYAPYTNGTTLRTASIVLDGSDQAYVLYRDSASAQRVVTVTWDGSDWQPMTVDSSGSAAHHNDISLDNKGYTHISYRVSTKDRFGTTGNQYRSSELRYGRWDGKAWNIETIAAPPAASTIPAEKINNGYYNQMGVHNALALDSTGSPHFSYFQSEQWYDGSTWNYSTSLNHAWWDGSAWATEALVSSTGTEEDKYPFSSIAIDSKGYVHISYYDESNYVPMYIRQNSTGWLPAEQVGDYCDGSNTCGNWSDMALDSSDHPHISYHNYNDGELIYAYYDGTDWQTTMVDDCDGNGYCGKSTAIVLDSSNTPHISYRDGGWDDGSLNGNALLKYATMKGSTWTTMEASYRIGGGDTAIAIDRSGTPHISYWDGYYKAPRYATNIVVDGIVYWKSEFIDDARSWDAVEDGDQGPMMGKSTAIFLDSAGRPQFVYSDQTTQNIRHAGELKLGGPFSWPMFVPAITGAGIR